MRIMIVAAAALLVASAGVGRASDADHIEHRHRSVRIGAGSLHPRVQHVDEHEAIGWLNYSGRIARVSFEADVATKMFCTAVTGFRVTGPRLESPGIQARQFAAVCRLEPGEYAYRVELYDGASASGRGYGRTLEGKLIVE